MTDDKASLDALRREIDSLDDAMHDLLMRRAALAERVRAAKGSGALFRPGREMEILRRLAGRHKGPLPIAVVVGLWRQIVSGLLSLQGEFEVAVHAPAGHGALVDLARRHFGVTVTATPAASVGVVLSAVADGAASLGVLPMPEDCPNDPWWRALGRGREGLTVIGLLPVVAGGGPRALTVARQDFEPTGEDRAYITVESDRDVSRARLKGAFDAVGLVAVDFPARAADGALVQILVEIENWCAPDDPRLAALGAKLGEGEHAIRVLGGYAVPIPSPKRRTTRR